MKSILSFAAAVASVFVASTGTALAAAIPEPGTIALVGVGIAGVILFAKRRK
jgi:hypothetical protein